MKGSNMKKNNYDEGFQEVARQLDYLKDRIEQLENILASMGDKEFSNDPLALHFYYHKITAIERLPEDFKKMKELTKCDDYEYKTTPETKQLIKIVRKPGADE